MFRQVAESGAKTGAKFSSGFPGYTPTPRVYFSPARENAASTTASDANIANRPICLFFEPFESWRYSGPYFGFCFGLAK